MNIAEERRDHDAAGSLADELPYWGWIRESLPFPCCITRSGELFAVARLTPTVLDGRTAEQLDRVVHRWQRLLSSLDPQTRLHFYLFRRPGRLDPVEGLEGVAELSRTNRRTFLLDRVQDLQTYVVWSHDPQLAPAGRSGTEGGRWWLDTVRNWVRRKGNPDLGAFLLRHVLTAADSFRQLVDASCAMASDVTPLDVLSAPEASAFLSELVNRPGLPWHGGDALASALNWRLALSELEAERRHLRLDGEPLILYSLLSPPTQARANLLQDLFCLPGRITVSLEWRPYSLEAARRKIRGAQRHYFSKRYSMMAHVQETEGTASAMVDSAADAESGRLGGALVELEADGIAYGDIGLTVALHGELGRIEALDAEIRRIFGGCDAKVIREGYGQLAAWFSRMPAQPRRRQIRHVFASAGVAACLAPLFGPAKGETESRHLRRPALAVLETPWRTPYHYDLFCGDVGHTLILGATGAGKSFLLNFLLVQALQYNPRVLVLDLGGSYRWLTQFLGGGYLELSPETVAATGIALKPFSLPETERTYGFLTGWVTRLLRLGGYTPEGADATELRARVEDIYTLPPADRRLSVFVASLPRRMWPAMSRWHGDGTWAPFFDNAGADELKFADWQVIDLAGAAEHEDLCEAALFYLLERLRIALDDPAEASRVKLMVVDEAWRYLNDPSVLAYLAEAAKTWRKRNAALVLATQSAVDVTSTRGAGALLESMPTKLFLANPDLPDAVAETFRLNPAEMATIRGLLPKRELYLRRAQEAGVVRLEVDPESYWLYTSSPVDQVRRAAAVEEHGLRGGLTALATEWR